MASTQRVPICSVYRMLRSLEVLSVNGRASVPKHVAAPCTANRLQALVTRQHMQRHRLHDLWRHLTCQNRWQVTKRRRGHMTLHRSNGVGRLARRRWMRGQTATNSQNFIHHKHGTDTHQPGKETLVERGKDGETKTHTEEQHERLIPVKLIGKGTTATVSRGNRCYCKTVS